MVPKHSGSPSHARDARHCCGRSKQNIYHRRSSRKAQPRQRLIRARQLSFRLASRAGDGSDPAFSHLCLLPALPDRRAWAPLSWTRWLTPGASVTCVPAMVPGRAGWVRLHKGANRIPQLLSRIRLLPSNLLAPLPSSFPCALSPTQIAPHFLREMASLVHPRRFQTEEELNTVRRLLGWSAQETG